LVLATHKLDGMTGGGTRLARSFDRVAEDYERGRPGWPVEAIDTLRLPRSTPVLELGAGTGKLTRVLVERFDRVVAVEPLRRMRAKLEELVPQAEALEGRAEEIPLPDRLVGAVFVAEAFHWFDWERALAEIGRVLEPRGSLVLLWNRPPEESPPPWPDAVNKVLDRLRLEPPRSYGAREWRDALRHAPFGPLRLKVFRHERELDREEVVALMGSWSTVAALPASERKELLDEIRSLLDQPSYTVQLETRRYRARLTG
jgi:ubiquinone/menaquinone biosynthesis C-methylase UbiE